mgnify:CR=1 FL=1|jgi:hypothetical protein|tara:strand:- start:90 stop:533 length:444 start_codon:yes stop_codon:yes gene_type:complete
MSLREDIAANIITVLDAVTSPIELKKITREPFKPEELADPQFPALYITTGDETREDYTLGDSAAGKRSGTIDYVLIGYVKGTDSNLDTKRNQLIEVIEETLDTDRTRGGNSLNSQIVEVSSDEGTLYPLGGVRIVVRVFYEFVRGTA